MWILQFTVKKTLISTNLCFCTYLKYSSLGEYLVALEASVDKPVTFPSVLVVEAYIAVTAELVAINMKSEVLIMRGT